MQCRLSRGAGYATSEKKEWEKALGTSKKAATMLFIILE